RMMFASQPQGGYTPAPAVERALDVLLILHLDHEQNCSTSTLRAVASAHSDLFCAAAGAMAALFGPLHGGANEEVLRMLREIRTRENIAGFMKGVEEGRGKLVGLGHRVYENYDPPVEVIMA